MYSISIVSIDWFISAVSYKTFGNSHGPRYWRYQQGLIDNPAHLMLGKFLIPWCDPSSSQWSIPRGRMSLSCSSMARMTNVSIQGAAKNIAAHDENGTRDENWIEQIDDGTKVVCFLALVRFWDQNSCFFFLDPPQKVVSCGFIIICSIQRAIFFRQTLWDWTFVVYTLLPWETFFFKRRVMKDTFEQLRYFVDERLIFREFGTSWAPSHPVVLQDSQ